MGTQNDAFWVWMREALEEDETEEDRGVRLGSTPANSLGALQLAFDAGVDWVLLKSGRGIERQCPRCAHKEHETSQRENGWKVCGAPMSNDELTTAWNCSCEGEK